MRKVSYTLAAVLVFAAPTVGPASNASVQPSYDALMAMPSAERQAALRGMEEMARRAIFQTHIDRWLSENRRRLSASQFALVTEVRNALMQEPRDQKRMVALDARMRCELWRSDMMALSLPHRDEMSSSWFNDVRRWVGDCVLAPALDAVF
jgi:hypothetical protein